MRPHGADDGVYRERPCRNGWEDRRRAGEDCGREAEQEAEVAERKGWIDNVGVCFHAEIIGVAGKLAETIEIGFAAVTPKAEQKFAKMDAKMDDGLARVGEVKQSMKQQFAGGAGGGARGSVGKYVQSGPLDTH